jgi:hypothetical protein
MLTSQLLNSSHSYMISTDSQKRTTKWNLQKTKLNTLKSVFHSIMKWTLTSKNTLLTLTHNAVKNYGSVPVNKVSQHGFLLISLLFIIIV